jgi:hypothetical protein
MKVLAVPLLFVLAGTVPAESVTPESMARTIGMLRLSVSLCDFGLTQPAIDVLQAGAEMAYSRGLNSQIFAQQEEFLPLTENWSAEQHASFCEATRELARELELI